MWARLLLNSVIFLVFIAYSPLKGQETLSRKRSFIHYTDAEGLPFLSVTDFIQDPSGFMWVATRIGISHFDGYTFREIKVMNKYDQPVVLSSPLFIPDPKGEKILVRSWDNRIFEYRKDLALFKECSFSRSREYSPFLQVAGLDNGFWLLEDKEVIYLDAESGQEVRLIEKLPFVEARLKDQRCLGFVQQKDMMYLVLETGNLLQINLTQKSSREIVLTQIPGDRINQVLIDSTRKVWIATDDAGAFRVDPEDGQIEHFAVEASGSYHITNNMIRDLGEDREGNVWIGTENGLCIWDLHQRQMEYYQYDINYPEGLNSNAVYVIYCDTNGDSWVGTYFGGINLYSAGEAFFKKMTSGIGPGYLTGNQVSCLTEDGEGNLYVGFEGDGINRIDALTGRVEKICHIPGKNSLSYDNVHALKFGLDERLYIATFTGGLNIYDPRSDYFQIINQQNTPNLPSDNIYSLLPHGDTIFIGTDNGLAIYSLKNNSVYPFYEDIFAGKMVHSICHSGDYLWFSTYADIYKYHLKTGHLNRLDKFQKQVSISFVIPDENENIWIGDNFDGLRIYWKDKDVIQHFSPDDGFPAKRVYGMNPGNGDHYWISTSKGLVKFSPITQNAVVFDRQSGLPFTQFNYQAYYQTRGGTIYFGGVNGLVYFNDQAELEPQAIEKVVFSDFDLFYRSVEPGKGTPLEKPIHETKSIRLKYHENVFTIHYSALDFTHPGRVQYAYYLEGFETNWNLVGNKRMASYTNLSPGTYTFFVKASYDNTNWSDQVASLQLIVAPPFWRTDLAYLIYTILIAVGLWAFYLIRVKIEESKTMLALERQEKSYQENLNRLKLEFFTNISHELRTPLTLIIGPLNKLLSTQQFQLRTREKLEHIYHNAQRLVYLINQLLDFRKIETGQEKLKVRKGNISIFISEIKEAFEGIAELRNIQFELDFKVTELELYFDQEKLERMLFNLLSNAFKYTPDGGRIRLKVKTFTAKAGKGTYLQLKVQDTGVGIPKDQLQHIFHRYYQGENLKAGESGSGIGLAFVNSLVRLHKGSLRVRSEVGVGSSFSLRIPVAREAYEEHEVGDAKPYSSNSSEWLDTQFAPRITPSIQENHIEKPQLLVVDDHLELLAFLQDSLADKFNVQTATNGEEALHLLKERMPELVISDVMMPVMDGLEFTRRLKENIETSHIPVILLTAKAELEHHLEGFSSGADFYIEKPFYPELLIKHIENILTTRRRLIDLFKRDIYLTPSEIGHSKSDQEFIEKLTHLIEENIDHPNLDVSFILKEMCVSRSLLHLKLKKIVNCSTTEYIRTVRLKKAAKLIITGEKTITEAAYVCGFSSPSLFSRRFKEFFGKSPRAYAKAHSKIQ